MSISFDQIAFFVNPTLSLLSHVLLDSNTNFEFIKVASSMLHFLASYHHIEINYILLILTCGIYLQKLSKVFANSSSNQSQYSIIEHFSSTILLPLLSQFHVEALMEIFEGHESVLWEFSLGFVRLIRVSICSFLIFYILNSINCFDKSRYAHMHIRQ